MQISSSAFENNNKIPKTYTCDGENINPPLLFRIVPQNAKSLVLIMHDPDAPVSGGFTHWIIYNMNPETKDIQENSKPKNGIEGSNDASEIGYIGPCPPSGTHRYFFKLYALDAMLDFPKDENKEAVEHAMEGHIIETAELIGLYTRV